MTATIPEPAHSILIMLIEIGAALWLVVTMLLMLDAMWAATTP